MPKWSIPSLNNKRSAANNRDSTTTTTTTAAATTTTTTTTKGSAHGITTEASTATTTTTTIAVVATNATAQQQENENRNVLELLESGEWNQLVRWVKTRQGKSQVQLATLQAAKAIQTTENDVDAASRPVAPLELSLWKRSRAPEEVVFALVQAYPQAAQVLYNPQPRLFSGSVVPLQKICKLGPNDERLSVRVLRALLAAHPPAVQIADRTGRLALHLACQTNAPSAIVRELVAAYPEAASVADNTGMLPLHLLCTAVLVPTTATTRYTGTNTTTITSTTTIPTSYSSSCSCSGAVTDNEKSSLSQHPSTASPVQVLLCAFPDGLYAPDKHGRLPIHCACARGDEQEDAILEMLRVDSSIAAIPCRDGGGGGCGGGGEGGRRQRLPLLTACCVEHSTRVVRHLLRVFPQAAGIPDAMGCLPLCHVAARKSSSTAHNPRAAALAVSRNGDNHDGIERGDEENSNSNRSTGLPRVWQERWHLLVDAYPGAVFRHCPTCHTSPLDKQIRRRGGAEDRDRLILTSLSKDHLSFPHGKDGSLVLHMACQQPEVSLDDIQLLAEMHPAALSTANTLGQLPLHVALANQPGVPVDILRFLVERYPEALSTANAVGQLPLHVAAANEYYQDELTHLAVVEFLLESHGAALYVPNKRGFFPLVHAFQNTKASLHVLYTLLRQHPTFLVPARE